MKQVKYGIQRHHGKKVFIFNSFQCGKLTPRQFVEAQNIVPIHGFNSTPISQGLCEDTGITNYMIELGNDCVECNDLKDKLFKQFNAHEHIDFLSRTAIETEITLKINEEEFDLIIKQLRKIV